MQVHLSFDYSEKTDDQLRSALDSVLPVRGGPATTDDLESAFEGEVRSIRQHHLQYDPRRTPNAQQEAGFEFDSSIGVAGDSGFRCGTSYPWEIIEQRDGSCNVVEIPYIAGEGSWLKSHRLDLTRSIALQRAETLIDRVRDVGGVFTFYLPPAAVSSSEDIELYENILEYASDAGGWFGTVSEIGDWWKDNCSEKLRRFGI